MIPHLKKCNKCHISLDHYDSVSITSAYWGDDATGGIDDCNLFIETITGLKSSGTQVQVLGDQDTNIFPFQRAVLQQAESMTGRRRLYILHYAGSKWRY